MPGEHRTVGIVSPGAMGSAVGSVLARGGARVVATLAGRSERTAGLARRAGIEGLPDLEAVVRESDAVLSIAPPDEAESIARDLARAARAAGARPLVADLNAIAPATAARIAATLAGAGLDLVDGSISGPPPWTPGTTRIYLSGARAAELPSLPFAGVNLIVVGEEVGAASAVKMCTASVYKGSVALLTHALLTARTFGVLEPVLGDLGESSLGLVDRAGPTIARAATKAGRYVGEMREIAETQAAAGLTPELFEAMAAVYAALAESPLARRPEDVDPDVALEDVLEGLRP